METGVPYRPELGKVHLKSLELAAWLSLKEIPSLWERRGVWNVP